MNEPVEYAQASTGKVTARQLLQCVRAGTDNIFMHGKATPDRQSYSDSFVFSVSAVAKDRKTKSETTTKLDVPGWVSNGHTSERKEHPGTDGGRAWVTYAKPYRPLRGFWSLTYDRLIDLLELIPGDAEVSFHVYLDAGTNELLIGSSIRLPGFNQEGLHGDHLYLNVTRMVRGKPKTSHHLISTSTGAHNSGRFGGPVSETDSTGRMGY